MRRLLANILYGGLFILLLLNSMQAGNRELGVASSIAGVNTPLLNNTLEGVIDSCTTPLGSAGHESLTANSEDQLISYPDNYGYTWDDAVTMNWIDATSGTNTGLSQQDHEGADVTEPISLGFSFPFYEETYTELYISSAGAVGFDVSSLQASATDYVPFTGFPNNFIAPYLVHLYVNDSSYTGQVYYLRGGVAPNRYFVVEWHGVQDEPGASLTFEVVLWENGNITFQFIDMSYGQMTKAPSFSGIEDKYGWDGLAYLQVGANKVSSGTAVLFRRPESAARVSVWTETQGSFAQAAETEDFLIFVRNTGDYGTDTYDIVADSAWELRLFGLDRVTELTDTNADGNVDTGPVIPGDVATVLVSVTTPNSVNVGDSNSVSLSIMSSIDPTVWDSFDLITSIPAPFAQAFVDEGDGAMSLYLADPMKTIRRRITPDDYGGIQPVVAETTSGLFYLWEQQYYVNGYWATYLEYTFANYNGQTTRDVSMLTTYSDPPYIVRDRYPAVASSSDGRVGVIWYRYIYNNELRLWNYNIYFTILNEIGDVVIGPVNLTQNAEWGCGCLLSSDAPQFSDARIEATDNGHFVLVWTRQEMKSDGVVSDIYYAIRDASGAAVVAPTALTADIPDGSGYRAPTLTALQDGACFVAFAAPSGIDFSVLNSEGGIAKAQTTLSNYGYWPDATLLSNGSILIAWRASSYGPVIYAVIDGTTYNLISPSNFLYNPTAAAGQSKISVAADLTGHGIITWGDYQLFSSFSPNLYYALIDGTGNVVTPPTQFYIGNGSNPRLGISFQGYGNTSYNRIRPTTTDVDMWVTGNALTGGNPGGRVIVPVQLGNYGESLATDVTVEARIEASLSVVDVSPTPISIKDNSVTWLLPDLSFLGNSRIFLYTTVPSATIGTRFPVTITVTSTGPEANLINNTLVVEVMVSHQVYLPISLARN